MSDPTSSHRGDLGLVLSGGGARAAYQAGVLRCLARNFPGLRFPIVAGVSAGAINAAFLAGHTGPPAEAAPKLCELWGALEVENIFEVDVPSLARSFIQWATRLASGGSALLAPDVKGLVDTRPLESTMRRATAVVDGELIGIEHNLERGLLKAIALTALNYTTGQTVTWVQGADIGPSHHPQRPSFNTRMTVDHIMASAALPLFFPAVRLGDAWYGDGGVRLTAPMSPALRLGASRILSISPHYSPNTEEAGRHQIRGYPPPAQILSHMLNSVFLDVMDEDVRRLESINHLLAKIEPEERRGLRLVDILVIRPSRDLGKLAAAYEPRLPRAFRYLTRSLGTRETSTPDFLTYIMFQPDYLQCLIEIGESDAEARLPELRELIGD
ncbi:MAG TPA: patatin-like phospholipase family protein [Thermoanaerobaculia bacterium]|nr:patatin-like phospholipase family protein [Thermoanaerobaculia bacterium]